MSSERRNGSSAHEDILETPEVAFLNKDMKTLENVINNKFEAIESRIGMRMERLKNLVEGAQSASLEPPSNKQTNSEFLDEVVNRIDLLSLRQVHLNDDIEKSRNGESNEIEYLLLTGKLGAIVAELDVLRQVVILIEDRINNVHQVDLKEVALALASASSKLQTLSRLPQVILPSSVKDVRELGDECSRLCDKLMPLATCHSASTSSVRTSALMSHSSTTLMRHPPDIQRILDEKLRLAAAAAHVIPTRPLSSAPSSCSSSSDSLEISDCAVEVDPS